jgi:hypothetical protein
VGNPPQWFLDGKHFLNNQDGRWQLGNVNDATTQDLNFLDAAGWEADGYAGLTWINDEFFCYPYVLMKGGA